MQRSLLSLAMAIALIVTAAGHDVAAKPSGRDGRAIQDLVKITTAVQYLEGLGFGAAAVAKFKQHKDNPSSLESEPGPRSDDAPSFDDALPDVEEDECPSPSPSGAACQPGQDG